MKYQNKSLLITGSLVRVQVVEPDKVPEKAFKISAPPKTRLLAGFFVLAFCRIPVGTSHFTARSKRTVIGGKR